MALTRPVVVSLIIILAISPDSSAHSIIQMRPVKETILASDGVSGRMRAFDLYCESWRFTVETNDAGIWSQIPAKCVDFVKDYMTGDIYSAESEAVAESALAYVKAVELSGNGKDVCVFDIDETLLTNIPYYQIHGFGSEIFDEVSFNNWVDLADAPALPASLRLYKELQELGFTIFLLTGRDESQRNVTGTNLQYAGYSNWKRLILRGDSDHGKLASVYKSEKKQEIEDEGYIIRGKFWRPVERLDGICRGEEIFQAT